jgi:hypothetical protein
MPPEVFYIWDFTNSSSVCQPTCTGKHGLLARSLGPSHVRSLIILNFLIIPCVRTAYFICTDVRLQYTLSEVSCSVCVLFCRECGDCFQNREALALHYRLHAGDRNFVADLCGLAAAFQQPAAHFLCPTPLHPTAMSKLNQSSVGTSTSTSGIMPSTPPQPKPKPHICPDCGKCFAQKHGLAQHNRRHSGGSCDVRQHACDKCGKAFFQKNHLALHQRQHMEHSTSDSPTDTKTFEVNIPVSGE